MILVSQQPLALGGWLGSINKIAQADVFVILDTVQYVPKSFNNRNKIRTKDGWQWLTVPVLSKGYLDKQFLDIEIDNSTDWRRKHLRTIELAYSKAKYFDDYYPKLEQIYEWKWSHLTILNETLFRWSLTQLGITLRIESAQKLMLEGVGSDRVIDMCKKIPGIDIFLVGAGAEPYTDVEGLKAVGVETVFQGYNHPVYEQCYSGFESGMCILDLLFNEGPNSLKILRGEMQLSQ